VDIGSGLMFVEHQPTSIAKIAWQPTLGKREIA
jgi:hypothetical protein